MAYCHICETECADITRHLFSCHTQPGATNPSIAAGAPNEFEPGEDEDEQTFCFQCSREFRTVAGLAAHLRDAQVHFRTTGNSARVSLGMLGYPPYHATGLDSRSSRSPENQDRDYEGSDAGNEDSSEELTSESDEDDDVPMDIEYHRQNHPGVMLTSQASRQAQYSQTPGLVTGEAQPPNVPGAYIYTFPLSAVNPPGVNTYAQEGMSMSYPRPESELTTEMSNYYHRSGAAHRPFQTEDSSHASQTHDASVPRGRGIMCPICLDPAENVTSTLCGHIFCGSCINSALSLRQACPVCNRPTDRRGIHPIYPVF